MVHFKLGHRPDYIFLFCLLALLIFGFVILSSASSDLGKIKFNDTYYYLKHQLTYGLSLGVLGFFLTNLVHYRHWQKLALPLLLLNIGLLVLVFTPLGFRHAGASRWLSLGSFTFQPAEFLKFTFILYLATWLNPKDGFSGMRQKSLVGGFIPLLIIFGIIGVLILLQPSTTTLFIIMVSALLVYFVSGAKLSHVLGFIGLAFLLFAFAIYITPYRFERMSVYWSQIFNPDSASIQDEGYHLNQALIAIGSGGPWGVGFGKSTTKYKYLPEPIGDSIFAVLAEELGFVGAVGLLAVFITFFIRGFIIAKNSRDQFAKLLTMGFISVMALQTFIHVAAISGIIPLTGVPLPFISYGGTSLAVFLTMAGAIVNISKYS